MKIRQKIAGIVMAMVCTASTFAGIQPLIANAYTEGTYGYLTYLYIDSDGDGTNDYVEITDCDESAIEVEIPEGIKNLSVKSIGDEAFRDCSYLTSIIIPDSVEKVGGGIFYNCTSLKSIVLSHNIVSLDYYYEHGPISSDYYLHGFFKNCSSLVSIEVPYNICSIGTYAFCDCSGLTSIIIKNPECEIYDDEFTISDTATIYGYENSTAQSYAEKYNRTFVALDEEPPVTTPAVTTTVSTTTITVATTVSTTEETTNATTTETVPVTTTKATETVPVTTAPVTTTEPEVPGDISGNGKIDLYDAIEICKSIMGMRTFTDEEKAIADYNSDGVVDLYDAIGIAKELLPK